MTRAKELLDAATPLPWEYRAGRSNDAWDKAPEDMLKKVLLGDGGVPLMDAVWHNDSTAGLYGREQDAALIVYAVNRLPAYEAAVEALERLVAFDTDPGELDALEEARAVLARLSDGVPLATGAKR